MEPLRPGAVGDTVGDSAPRPARRPYRFRQEAPVFAVVAVGGALGAGARYGAALAWPTPPGTFPWTTLVVNVTGCAVMGVFMVLAAEVWWRHRLLRPFVGTGILGGYTTFSAYAADIRHLLDMRQAATALAYLALTVTAALAVTWATAVLTQRMIRRKAA